MRAVLVLALAAVALAACASGSAGTSANGTSLTVTYWPNGVGTADPVRWTLRCNPARGTLPRPAVACSRLADAGAKVFAPARDSLLCTQIYGGPDVARVVGTVAGKSIWAKFTRVNGCQISRWERVSPWLLPRGGAR